MENHAIEIKYLKRAGDKFTAILARLNIFTTTDLLLHTPFRYENYGKLQSISELKINTNAHIIGTIELIAGRRSFKRKLHLTEAIVRDDTGTIQVVWFNQPFISKNLKVGDKVSLAGKVGNNYQQPVLLSPAYEKADSQMRNTSEIVPVYATTRNLSQKQLRFFIAQALPMAKEIVDFIPAEIINSLKLLKLPQAIVKAHFPKTEAESMLAKKRLAFNELFLQQLKGQIIKYRNQNQVAPQIQFSETKLKQVIKDLPFILTDDQKKALWQIIKDLEKSIPMTRILQGDVGSGKTIVAALAMANVVYSGYQAILMVPTSILALQHFSTFQKIFQNQKISLGLLTANEKTDTKNTDIIIGTQALIQDNVKFKNPALVVTDEQHRFGVNQRQKLAKINTHFLSMTATPIPRSLALTIYGDLDLSVIKQKPEGRKKIITKIINNDKREKLYEFAKQELEKDHQIYVVCPLIDPSDTLGAKSVKDEYERLRQEIFPDATMEILSGKTKAKEKDRIMEDFQDNKVQVLVSTAVIEVGIDNPNATVMIIENAERFGLAQLHQFRGRVGRGEAQSSCFLCTEKESVPRLNIMEKTDDGFLLAQADLKLRGSGDFYGQDQSGFFELNIGSLFDYELIKQANQAAIDLINADPNLTKYPELRKKLAQLSAQTHLE